ncbi:hypothetical protein M3Y99_01136800 [Aphelenchoides fujianensis]|nr:hypothetical protein M3Y99_01136800 [Aphelenchoides fujianensis]
MWDSLPAEIRLQIASYVDVVDLFTLMRVSRSWRRFVENNAAQLPKRRINALHVEQFASQRFPFRLKTVEIREEKKTRLVNYCLRTPNYIAVFLQFHRVQRTAYLRLMEEIGLEEEFGVGCREIETLSVQLDKGSHTNPIVFVDYLARLADRLPALKSFSVEDASDNWRDDAHRMLTKLKKPRFIEARSKGSRSQLAIGDETLVHFGRSEVPLDCIVLSTNKSAFSLDAVRYFLENVNFMKHGLLELYFVKCTTNEFFNLLTDLKISFDGEPTRGIYNSFPIHLRGQTVCLNIKYFKDSRSGHEPYLA